MMMSFLLSMLVSVFVFGQNEMPRDEYGYFSYYEVVELPGYPSALLFDNAKSFLKDFSVRGSKKKYFSYDKDSLKLVNTGSYRLSDMLTLGKRVDGIVKFDMHVEIKEGRYRYIIDNFFYQEFEKNRYGKFEPVTGSDLPLETEASRLSKKQWEIHQTNTHEKIQTLITDFMVAMATVEGEKEKKKRSKREKDW